MCQFSLKYNNMDPYKSDIHPTYLESSGGISCCCKDQMGWDHHLLIQMIPVLTRLILIFITNQHTSYNMCVKSKYGASFDSISCVTPLLLLLCMLIVLMLGCIIMIL